LIDDGSRYILNTTFSGSGFGNYLWGAEIGNAGVFSPDGQYFALMHKGKNITDSSGNVTRESDRLRIFHISDNVLIQKIHADYTDDVIFSPDATFLVSWTGREGFENGIGSVQVWNLGNGSSVFTSGQVYKEHYAAPEMTIRFLAFSSDSMGLYYADLGEGGLKLVNIQDGKQTVIGYPCMMSILDGIDPGQDFSNCDTNLLELYNAESAISIQGDKLAISNREDIKIYSYPKLELLNILQGLGENVCELTFSPDGMMLVASLGDTCGLGGNRIRTIHVNGEIGQEFDIKGLISDIKLLPDGRSFIGRIREGYFSSIGIWDLSNGQLIRKFDTGNFRFYALSSSGNILATSKDTQWYSEINFWNVEDGVHLRTIYTPFRRPPPLSFSPDGTMFAAGYLDGTIHIWGVKP
jgi:WD40 repeat protein